MPIVSDSNKYTPNTNVAGLSASLGLVVQKLG